MPTVALDGSRFYYEERGKGLPLLLIHGTGASSALLADVAQQLAPNHRVITYDRRGYAQTGLPPANGKDYLRRHVEDAAALLRELGAPNARIFGWSMGGLIALGLAVHHPAAVSRLVLYEAPLHVQKHANLRTTRKLGGALALAKLGLHRRAAKRFFRFALEYKKGGNAFDELDAAMQNAALSDAGTVIAELGAGGGESLTRAALERVRCPIGLIVGERSAPFITDAVDRTAKLYPAAHVVRVPNGDHVMNLRQPDVLARAIEDLLGRV